MFDRLSCLGDKPSVQLLSVDSVIGFFKNVVYMIFNICLVNLSSSSGFFMLQLCRPSHHMQGLLWGHLQDRLHPHRVPDQVCQNLLSEPEPQAARVCQQLHRVLPRTQPHRQYVYLGSFCSHTVWTDCQMLQQLPDNFIAYLKYHWLKQQSLKTNQTSTVKQN